MTAGEIAELDFVFNRLEEIGRQFLTLLQDVRRLLFKLRMTLACSIENRNTTSAAARSAAEGKPSKPAHIGQIVRRLRKAAGLTRAELAQQVHLADSTVRNVESARHRPTRQTIRKLRKHPAMARLRPLARKAGLYPDLGGNRAGQS